MAEQRMSAAERAEFIGRVDREMADSAVEAMTAEATRLLSDRQPGFPDRLSAAGPGHRIEVVADAMVEHLAQLDARDGWPYVHDEVGRSADVDFASLEMARTLQEAAERTGPDTPPAVARFNNARARAHGEQAVNSADVAILAMKVHDARGGLDSSGRLPGPVTAEPSNPIAAPAQERLERLAQEYGEVLADHRDRHSGLLEARRVSGIDVVRSPSEALSAKSPSSDGTSPAVRVETQRTSPERG